MNKITEKVRRNGDKTTVIADIGYEPHVKKLLTMKNNGNGYTIKFHSHSSCVADRYLSLDYSEAYFLYLALSGVVAE